MHVCACKCLSAFHPIDKTQNWAQRYNSPLKGTGGAIGGIRNDKEGDRRMTETRKKKVRLKNAEEEWTGGLAGQRSA